MAIQNFLSGGFYGSIGKLTGRRWKNKRVVQAKFKPKNPRTPAQEEQRRLFTRGSALAKIAQQVNWKAPQFDNPIRTDWNQRQTVAINALKDGATEWEALPLAPKNFKAQHIIGECQLVGINEDKEAKLFLQGTNLLENKKYACAIFINSGKKKGQIIVGSGTTDLEVSNYVTIRLPETDGIKGEECYIKIASYGDTETDTVTLSAGILLQQDVETPYVFNPSITSIKWDNDNGIIIKVKLGQEALESYDAFEQINPRFYGKIWTKQTAVESDILDEENAENVDTEIETDKITVAKSTATVSFYIQDFPVIVAEKYELKIDISFNANNIKGTNTVENSELVQLTAQEFPEYLQEEYIPNGAPTLYANTTDTVTDVGDIALVGDAYADEAETNEMQLIAINEDFEGEEFNYSGITSVTTTDGRTYSGSEVDDFLNDQSPTPTLVGTKIGWKMQEDIQLKSWKGTASGTLYCDGYLPKFALAGYRTYTIPSEYDDKINIILKP